MKIVTSVHVDGAMARSKEEKSEVTFTFGIGTVLVFFRDEMYADQAKVTMTATQARELAHTLLTFAEMADLPVVAMKGGRA